MLTFTGIELLRVLIRSATPILMIAFTNHALDHLLTGVLDVGITNKIVRLGSRSADERIKQFSIEEIEQIAGRSRLDRTFACDHRALKDIEKEIQKLMQEFSQTAIPSDAIITYLVIHYPEHAEHVQFPPSWISTIHAVSSADENAGWQTIGSQANAKSDGSIYSFWERGVDLEFLSGINEPQLPGNSLPRVQPEALLPGNKFILLEQETADVLGDNDDSDEEDRPWLSSWGFPAEDESSTVVLPAQPVKSHLVPSRSSSPANSQKSDLKDPADFFSSHGCAQIPSVPDSNRSLDELLIDGNMWTFSTVERKKLHAFWEQQVRESVYLSNIKNFERLRAKYMQALKVYNEGKDEVILRIPSL
ncbi:hypothetical protein C0992_005273 [Termitomyces sp. T32_za158]|nr:hypothetical protein C0992_005273 [Termitomyces sp. T32_za158]